MNSYEEMLEWEERYNAADPDMTSPEPERTPTEGRVFGWVGIREARLEDGMCPMPGCGGTVDVDWFCSMCGNVSLPARLVEGVSPGTLGGRKVGALSQPDEYAPAALDEEAA